MDITGLFTGTFGLVLSVFVLVLAVIWVLLPFAVVAIQKRVTEQADISKKMLSELKSINRGIAVLIAEVSTEKKAEPVKKQAVASTTKTCASCMQENAKTRTTCSRCGKLLE